MLNGSSGGEGGITGRRHSSPAPWSAGAGNLLWDVHTVTRKLYALLRRQTQGSVSTARVQLATNNPNALTVMMLRRLPDLVLLVKDDRMQAGFASLLSTELTSWRSRSRMLLQEDRKDPNVPDICCPYCPTEGGQVLRARKADTDTPEVYCPVCKVSWSFMELGLLGRIATDGAALAE